MAIFSTFTLIRGLSLLHLSVAYFLLTNPRVIAEQSLVVLLGEAMEIVRPLSSLFLLLLSSSDLLATTLPTRSALEYYSAIVPARLLFLFILTTWIYLTSSSPYDTASTSAEVLRTLKTAGGAGGLGLGQALGLLKNNLVFGIGFFEACSWFWVYTSLREERREFVFQEAKLEAQREEERKERAVFGR